MALTDRASASGGIAVSSRTRLLVMSPHPDDETIGTGILLQQVSQAGGRFASWR